jgi:putative GTP pyrophosphokinase
MRFGLKEFDKLKQKMVRYECALKNMKTRIDILNDDFEQQQHNPIEHIKHRLKSPESIADKLNRLKLDITAKNATEFLTDIAGIRCICSYAKDINDIVQALKMQPDLKVIKEKNYVECPKTSGYRSYHMVLEVPIYLATSIKKVPVEVQIRTQAMDFWASLEHKARYKYKSDMPKELSDELIECAERIHALDERMFGIQERVDGIIVDHVLERR